MHEGESVSNAVDTYGQFGQTLAFAEATLDRILKTHLAARGIAPERWYALTLTAQGEPIARPALIHGLAAGNKVQTGDAEPLLAALAVDGLIEGHDRLSLTPAGRRYFAELREYVITPTIQLLGRSDLDDVETTIRTLREITERAQQQQLDLVG
jgi:DNA-binding MarR family transcriptional regulator